MTYKTEQEAFWAGEFGNDYIDRNQGDALLASNLDFLARLFVLHVASKAALSLAPTLA